jgi:hypothetical protein
MQHVIRNHRIDLERAKPTRKKPARPRRRLLASERANREWGRVYAVGLMLAVLFHVLVLLLWRAHEIPIMHVAAAGPASDDQLAAAGGGGGMQVIEVRVHEAAPDAVALVPIPEVEVEVVVEPTPDPVAQPAPVTVPQVPAPQPGTGQVGTGGDQGTATGPGTTDGTGLGSGGTEAAGDASRIVPPRPRGMIIPPTDRPRDVRGDVKVWVYVDANGRVVADRTRLEPPTSDANYNRRLRRSAAEWVFEPARQDGRPIAAWYSFEITL